MKVVRRRQYYRFLVVSKGLLACARRPGLSYLLFVEYRPETVEELERREDLTLYQHAGHYCCRGPPSCASGHLEPPLFYWQAA